MSDKKEQTKAGATELKEEDLKDVQGGYDDFSGEKKIRHSSVKSFNEGKLGRIKN